MLNHFLRKRWSQRRYLMPLSFRNQQNDAFHFLCHWSAWIPWAIFHWRNSSIGLRPKRAVICSISHAWEAREHPDPCGHQLPGRMPHALEYVIIQNAIISFMLIRKSFAKQIDGSRPRYFRVTETQDDLSFPIIPVLMKLYFCFVIWVHDWTLKAWYARSLVSTPFLVHHSEVAVCNRCILQSLCSFPPLDPLKQWFKCKVTFYNNHSWWSNFKECQMNSDAP